MSRWIEWIRAFAIKTNKSYGCALSDPECSASYRRKYGDAKKVPQRVEKERMGAEDRDALDFVQRSPPKRGRSKKYATPAEAYQAKLESNKLKRQQHRADGKKYN
jgi:hypothetical protein